ncbi:MAG: hypothetical protein AAF234_04250 [Pseudomonadota bacterium]
MKTLIRKARLLGLALALALAVQPLASVTTVNNAHAYYCMGDGCSTPISMIVTGGGGGGSSAGGWIVGGLFVSVASIIACAMIVGSEEGREMTLEEALLSGAIPLGCLFREHLADE